MTRYQPVARAKVNFVGATFTFAILGQAFRAVVQIWTALKNRRQVTLLNQLDDRALKDIGLVRSDVDAALCIPLHRDPSVHLMDVSGHNMPASRPVVETRGLHRLRRPDAVVTSTSINIVKA